MCSKEYLLPSRTVRCCLELVDLAVARRDGAFRDTIDAVLRIRVELTEAMPMHACAI